MTRGDGAGRSRRTAERLFGAPAQPPPDRPGTGRTAGGPAAGQEVPREPAPRAVRQAAALVAGEAIVLGAGALVLAWLTVAGHPTSVVAALGEAVFVALTAVFLAVSARGLWRVSSWARGPVIALQLLLALLGYTAVQAGRPVLGVPVLLLAAAEIYLLATPEARLAFFRRR